LGVLTTFPLLPSFRTPPFLWSVLEYLVCTSFWEQPPFPPSSTDLIPPPPFLPALVDSAGFSLVALKLSVTDVIGLSSLFSIFSLVSPLFFYIYCCFFVLSEDPFSPPGTPLFRLQGSDLCTLPFSSPSCTTSAIVPQNISPSHLDKKLLVGRSFFLGEILLFCETLNPTLLTFARGSCLPLWT